MSHKLILLADNLDFQNKVIDIETEISDDVS